MEDRTGEPRSRLDGHHPLNSIGVERQDFFRCYPLAQRPTEVPGYKEWHHFIVYAPGLRLLVNFNLAEARRAPAKAMGPSELAARLIVIADTGDWQGDIEDYSQHEVAVVPGALSARFGDNAMWFDQGVYHVQVRLRNGAIAAQLRLTPLTQPLLSNHIQLAPGGELSWLILPRLEVNGSVSVNGRRVELNRALGYHDHNWGRFDWGSDFAWEWGSIIPNRPDNPWTAVYVRMSNRRRSSVATQGLFIWHGERFYRAFQDDDLHVSLEGSKLMPAVPKLPRLMGLLAPGTCTGVPKRVVAFAKKGSDEVLMTFTTRSVSQVVIPDETSTSSTTSLNEAIGFVDLSGTMGGRPIEMEGSGVFEFIRS